MDAYIYLLEISHPSDVKRVQALLDRAGIPYRTGLLAAEPPRMLFTVPESRLEDAQAVLGIGDEAEMGRIVEPPQPFPADAWSILLAVMGLHFVIVFWMLSPIPPGRALLEWGALAKGGTMMQPWRLLTSILLHADFAHAFWNGVSMIVFGLPLLATLRLRNSALIYLLAGVGGGMVALLFAEAGTRIIGSSGAVAGLFGAWVVLMFDRARYHDLPRRERFRTMGIALLVLPSLLSPISSSGSRISVSSHLGGLATGMIIGMLISRGILARWRIALREARSVEQGATELRAD